VAAAGGDRPGADRSVLTIARLAGERVEVVDQRSWRSAGYPRVEAEVLALTRLWRFERLVVDATGLGGPIAARLERNLGHRAERFVFTASSKSDLGYRLVSAANSGRLALYASDGSAEAEALRLELRLCQSKTHGHGRLEWGNPTGPDDHAISLALCVHAAQQAGPARVAVGHRRE
jgi:hypothetical protein